MPILGIGADILQISRFTSLVSRRSHKLLARRILSPSEWDEWDKLQVGQESKRVLYLANRWAVKEATYKALYPAHRLTWKDVSLNRTTSQPKPTLTLSTDFQSSLDFSISLHTSISHDGDYLIAQVIAESLG